MKDILQWKCLICNNIWASTTSNIKAGHGCPLCARIHQSKRQLLNEYKITEQIKNINPNIVKLDLYIGAKQKINWQCMVCNYIWQDTPDHIKQGRGCRNCILNLQQDKKVKIKKGKKSPPPIKKILSESIIDDKIVKIGINITRLEIYQGMKIPILWNCNGCNYTWKIKPSYIIYKGQGCPKCSNTNQNEKLIGNILDKYNIPYIREYRVRMPHLPSRNTKRIDFYIPSINLAIEYNGRQHYEPSEFGLGSKKKAIEQFIKQQERDELIRKYCKDNAIQLLEIDGRKYKGIKLHNYLKQYIKQIFSIE